MGLLGEDASGLSASAVTRRDRWRGGGTGEGAARHRTLSRRRVGFQEFGR